MTHPLRATFGATAAVALLVGLTACSGAAGTSDSAAAPVSTASEAPATTSTAKPTRPEAAKAVPGAFVSYDAYQKNPAKFQQGDVVLFFDASWCPTCQEAKGNLTSQSIPDGLTVVDVDYDSNTALRQEYGVTTQHTFVQIDSAGQQLAKFTGSSTADEIKNQLS